MTSCRRSNRLLSLTGKISGFSLVEITLTIALLAILAGVTSMVVTDVFDAQRYETTRTQLERIRVAIVGDNALGPNGQRVNFGYAGDWGSLPVALANLTVSTNPVWAFNTTYGFGSGWKGPYVAETFNGLDPLKDAWNGDFTYTVAATTTVTSLGSDGGAGGTIYAKDLELRIPNSTWRGDVYGVVMNGTGGVSGVDVELRYPVDGVVTANTATTDGDGAFSFANIPFGVRWLKVTTAPTLGPRQIVVDSNPYSIPPDALNYFGTDVKLEAPCCRLTLDSSIAVTTADQTAKTSVYLLRHHGSHMPVFDGTSQWTTLQVPGAGISVAVPATTDTPFDIFVYNNAGSLALEALSWTDDTTRATALTTQDGILVKTGATTRRYLGTARTTGVSGETEDSFTKRFVWNMNNRARRALKKTDSTDTWTYTTATWRSANADNANRVEVIVGQVGAFLDLSVSAASTNSGAGRERKIGIDEDGTSANDADTTGYTTVEDAFADMTAFLRKYPTVGYHYYQWVEYSGAGNTTTWKSNSEKGLDGSIDG